ncbi:MAG: diguanylate cyclase domain-containing protein [bacterium]
MSKAGEGNEKAKLLVIGSSENQLELYQEYFEEKNYKVIPVSTGSEGVSSAFCEQPNIIILDSVMPEISGYVLCRLFKNEDATAAIPVILLTVNDEDKDRFWALKSGADHYLSIHADLNEVHEVVEFILKEIPRSTVKAAFSSSSPSLVSAVNHLLDNLLRESVLYGESLNLFNLVAFQDKLFINFFDLLFKVLELDYAILVLTEKKQPVKLFFHSQLPVSKEEINRIKSHWVKESDLSKDDLAEIEHQEFVVNEFRDRHQGDQDGTALNSSMAASLSEGKGTITIYSRKADLYDDDKQIILDMVAGNFSLALELMLQFRECKNQSILDEETGVFDSQYFNMSLETISSQAARYHTPLSLMLVEVDYYDTLVGTFGEEQGKATLKAMAKVFRSALRNSDILARVGDHKFAAILTHTDLSGGMVAAERIRSFVEREFAPSAQRPFKLTVSMGIVGHSEEIQNSARFYECAQEALDRAIENGGNQISQ